MRLGKLAQACRQGPTGGDGADSATSFLDSAECAFKTNQDQVHITSSKNCPFFIFKMSDGDTTPSFDRTETVSETVEEPISVELKSTY